MKKTESECVGCPSHMGCLGSGCSNYSVTRFYCDKCGEETTLYYYNGEEICSSCLLKEFEIVEGSEW